LNGKRQWSFILCPSLAGIDTYSSFCRIIKQEVLGEHDAADANTVFHIIISVIAEGGKLLERPRSDAGGTPVEIANGDPGYGFTVKNAELLAGGSAHVGHFKYPR
jgi:hypothetical protein